MKSIARLVRFWTCTGALLVVLATACGTPAPTPTPTLTVAQQLTQNPTPTPAPTRSVEQITLALASSKFLDSRHAAKGVQCQACHPEMQSPQAPKKETCLNCHGGSYEALGDKTASSKPNPHRSHNGELECTECHHVHEPFELYCRQCHKEFDFTRFP